VAAVNGNGRAVLPPGAVTQVTRYVQPPRRRGGLRLVGRILFGLAAALVLLGASLAGGTYLFFHESVADVRARTPHVKAAAETLDIALPNQPAHALIVGYDLRHGERGLPSRSDTLMLLRADPDTDAVSMLSFPRDLEVTIHCPSRAPYTDKINAAFSECKTPGTLETVRQLTGVPVNYLITVNFRAFKQVVGELGGVWVDVDRRYFNDNRGLGLGSTYATIDLQPGYQLLNGSDALDFVRYRHADNDIYRNARQQLFVRAVKERIAHNFGALQLPKLVTAITSNVEVAKGGNDPVSFREVMRWALFAYGLPPGHFFQTKIEGLNDIFTPEYKLYTDPSNIRAAVADLVSPDVQAADKAASAVGIKRKSPGSRAPRPSQVTVTVLNGNGRAGSAAEGSYLLAQRGYQTLPPPGNQDANALRSDYFRTQVYSNPARPRSQAAAQELQRLFGGADLTRGIPPELRHLAGGVTALVVVGQTFHGTIAPAPADRTPAKKPAAVRKDIPATVGRLREVARRVPFRLQVPTVLEKSSSLAESVRVYPLAEGRKGVRLTFKTSADIAGYWGIEQTDWEEAPILQERSFRHVFKDGRTYDLYFSGPRLHMIVLHHRGATYWVVNTLLDTLSNETMLAIAKGLKPLPRKQR